MADAEVNDSTVALLQRLREEDSATHVEHYSSYTKLTSLFIGILLPVLLSMLLMNKKKGKPRGVPVEIGADPGFTIRNSKFPTMVESPWEGATTLAALFEQACKRHAHRRLLGSRKLISRDIEVSEDGRRLEKLHLGNYEWLTYAETFERVCNFASGLVKLGHQREERAAIFAETREEWLIALHGCFRRNITVVTIYASLGEEALAHSLDEGVMMTHGNIVATASAVMTIVPGLGKKDTYLAYLPLAHILELAAEVTMVTAGCAIGYGSPLTLTDTSNKIKKGTKGDASVLHPTLMTAVPAILDRIRDGVQKKVEAKGGISKKLFDIAYNRRLAAIEGSWLGAWGAEKFLWDAVVFKKIHEVLGGHIRGLLSGGAPLSGDTQRFINICLGYTFITAFSSMLQMMVLL